VPVLVALALLAAYALVTVGSVVIYSRTRRALVANAIDGHSSWLAHNLFALGILLAIVLNVIPIPLSDDARYVGFPAPYLGWERHNGHWIDFVSPVSWFIGPINLLTGLGLVSLFAQVWLRFRRPPQHTDDPPL